MKILVCECNKRTNIEETELERLLDKYQIVIIGNKSESPEEPISDVIIKDPNKASGFNHLCKENIVYYTSASVQKQNGNMVFSVPMPAREIAKILENTIEYEQ